MPAPDKGGKRIEKPRARRKITRRWPRLDIGRALPTAPFSLVIAFRRRERDTNRRDARIRAQPQISAKDIALIGGVGQRCRHAAGCADKGCARLHRVGGIEPLIIEETDQVDI